MDTFPGWSDATMLLSAFAATGAGAYAVKLFQGAEKSFSDYLPVVHFAVLALVLAVLPWVVRGESAAY